MDLEKERGITIKAQSVRLKYRAKDGKDYQLNLIDTPGHVDFHYEVSRSLAACEGALLVVDAAQGVEAQTLANVYVALDNNLEIVPVLNKIDLPVARPDEIKQQIEDTIGLPADDACLVSAKTGLGIPDMVEALVQRIPPPTGKAEDPLEALIFDSWYDSFRGVVVLIRVFKGVVKKGTRVRFWNTQQTYECTLVAVRTPHLLEVDELAAGEVGIIAAAIKDISHARVGDTMTDADRPCPAPLPGFKAVKPMVFAGLYPVDAADYQDLKDALGKLVLNDAAVTYEPESSSALGFGFRCGFLGLLHMEIIQERLEREFDLNLITTAPSVQYKVYSIGVEQPVIVDNPAKVPDGGKFDKIEEPVILATVHLPQEYVGPIMQLCEERRGTQQGLHYDPRRPRARGLRDPAGRGGVRVLRSPEDDEPRLRVPRLRAGRLPRERPGPRRRAGQRRARRRVVDRRPQGQRLPPRRRAVHEDEGGRAAADVRRRDPGGDRQPDHLARDGQGDAQGRHRQVLRRRHLAQEEAPRQAEGRQEAHEVGRLGRAAAGGVPHRA
jgi:GTP-binding protein LepA